MGKRAYIKDGSGNWIPLVSSLPNMDPYATKGYVDINLLNYATQEDLNNIDLTATINTASAAAVSYLVDSAPSTLDTLNELSAALNDDASFASTVTTSLSTKQKLIPYQTSEPVSPSSGDMWVDSSTTPPALKVYNGSSWVQLGAAVDDSQAIISNRVF